MARYCTMCGKPLEENVTVCNHCGANPTATPEGKTPPVQPEFQTPPVQYVPPQYSPNPYPGYPGYPQNIVYVKAKIPGRGFAVASLVLGIIGLLYSLIFFTGAAEIGQSLPELEEIFAEAYYNAYNGPYGYYSAMNPETLICVVFGVFASMCVMAICFAIPAAKRGYRNPVQKAGLVLGIVGVVLYLLGVIILMTA